MKKALIFILVVILILGAGVGVFYLGRWTAKPKNEPEITEGNTTCKVQYLKDSYVQGESIVFEATVTSDVELTSLSFSVDNEEDETLAVKTGESKDLAEENKVGSGKYFIKSEVKIIDTTDLPAGWYPVVVKAADAKGNVYVLTTKPILVQITAAATTETPAAA